MNAAASVTAHGWRSPGIDEPASSDLRNSCVLFARRASRCLPDRSDVICTRASARIDVQPRREFVEINFDRIIGLSLPPLSWRLARSISISEHSARLMQRPLSCRAGRRGATARRMEFLIRCIQGGDHPLAGDGHARVLAILTMRLERAVRAFRERIDASPISAIDARPRESRLIDSRPARRISIYPSRTLSIGIEHTA